MTKSRQSSTGTSDTGRPISIEEWERGVRPVELICPKCRTANRPVAKFCMKCVTSLSSALANVRSEDDHRDKPLTFQKTERVERSARVAARNPDATFTCQALPDGTPIEGFHILRRIGEGGFGIVYLAWDAALERYVAIKEYMPSSLVLRDAASLAIRVRSESHRATFDAGLRSFVNEARLLARFDHPALVKVFRFWEANDTAYMAMPYYEGPTLRDAIRAVSGPVPESQLREWLNPLLDALSVLHRENCFHRDIAPDNILVTAGGPLLLDFGAARHVISDRTQALTAMLKPGFAPIEQYGGTGLQGPWTDLYALAGVLHYAITHRPPIASVVRVVDDQRRPLALSHAGQYTDGFLRAIDATLALRPEDRPQDVAQFRQLLDAGLTAGGPPHAQETGVLLVANRVAEEAAPAPSDARSATPPTPAMLPLRRNRIGIVLAATVLMAVAFPTWMQLRQPATTVAAPIAAPMLRAAPTSLSEWPAPAAVQTPPPAPSLESPSRALNQITVAAVRATAPATAAGPTSVPIPAAPPRTIARPKAVSQIKPPAAEPTLPAAVEVASSYSSVGKPPRCADLVLQSSLDSLNSEEATFLSRRCR